MSAVSSFVDLLRHGQTQGGPGFRGSTDDRLTALGMEQMWAAVSGKGRWGRIVASPLRRCAEFARALAQRLKVPLEIDDRLREIHFGTWEALTVEEIASCDPDGLRRFWADPMRHPPPGAESLSAFEARVLSCWTYQLRTHSENRVLFVTHGGSIRAILRQAHRISWTNLLRLDLPHASLTHVRVQLAADGSVHTGVTAASGGSC